MSAPGVAPARLGVVVVTYRAADFIGDCLESVMASDHADLALVVVDNASPDATVEAIRGWASGATPVDRTAWPFDSPRPVRRPVPLTERTAGDADTPPGAGVTLVHSGANLGFAGGVNLGLACLAADPAIGAFWVLNPDTVVPPGTAGAFARAAGAPGAALLGGRVLYLEAPETVHTDGGRLHPWRAGVVSVNMRRPAETTPLPDAGSLDFVSGASMVASRAFLDRAGPLAEDYFLYFEEIDWALRRGDMPIRLVPGAVVHHRAGASIGSGSGQAPPSSLSAFFMFRNAIRFTARWTPWWLPTAWAVGLLQIARRFGRHSAWAQAGAALRGLLGLGPPEAVRRRLGAAPWRGRRR